VKKELSIENVYKALEKNVNGMSDIDLQYRFFGAEEPTTKELEMLNKYIRLNVYNGNIFPKKMNNLSNIKFYGKNFIDENGNLK